MTPDAVAKIWPSLTDALGSRVGNQKRTRIDQQPLTFLPSGGHDGSSNQAALLRLRQGQGVRRQTRYAVLLADGTALPIRFRPKIIAELQARDALRLTPATLPDYLAFTWQFTGHGRSQRCVDPAISIACSGDGGWQVSGHWIENGQQLPLAATVSLHGQVVFGGEP